MNLLTKHFWKFFTGFAAIMLLGFFALWGAQYLHWKSEGGDASVNGEEFVREWQKQYENDTYGGKTPEETLALFIAALKSGDTDLAAKYMIIDQQDEVKSDLKEAKNAGRLNQVAQNLSLAKLSSKDNDNAAFSLTDSNNVLQYQTSLVRAPNGIWKILDL